MSLNHPSDNLDSTWEGGTDVPQPTALAETSPQSPSHHLLNPNDRTEGSVALLTPTEFQDPQHHPPRASHVLQIDGGEKPAALSCPQPGDQSWKQTRISPKPLPFPIHRLHQPSQPLPSASSQDRPPPGREPLWLATHLLIPSSMVSG